MRGDKTFAYDLVVSHGAVNSRVALLLRSIEAKPPWAVLYKNTPPFIALFTGFRREFRGLSAGSCSA